MLFQRNLNKPSLDHLTVTDYTSDLSQPLEGNPASKVLEIGCQYLNTMKAHYWLSSGTLIGLYRDHQLITFDTDLDVNVLTDISKPITYKPDGFKLVRTMYYDNLPMQTAYIAKKVIFDIYYFYTGIKRGKVINYNDLGIIEKPFEFVDKLSSLVFEGINYPIPNKIEKFLKWRFGNNWKIPRTNKQPWLQDANHLKPYS